MQKPMDESQYELSMMESSTLGPNGKKTKKKKKKKKKALEKIVENEIEEFNLS